MPEYRLNFRPTKTADLTSGQEPNHRATNNGSSQTSSASTEASPSTPMPLFDELPIPQTQRRESVINSYLSHSIHFENQNNSRAPRQAKTSSQVPIQSDILVRLIGWWHAKHALQYFLCYLLSSSVVILLCLWLFRLCDWHQPKTSNFITSNTMSSSSNICDFDRSGLQATYLGE